jgi:uncharacterized protein
VSTFIVSSGRFVPSRRTLAAAVLALAGPWATGLAGAATAPPPAPAASAPDTRLPLTSPSSTAFMTALYQGWYAPHAQRLLDSTRTLSRSSQAWCAGGGDRAEVRRHWTAVMQDWTELSAISIGPLLARHSDVRVDFYPTRPASLDKAIATPMAGGGWDLDRVGAPARGLTTLEFMLWKRPAAPKTPACSYLTTLTADLADEATGLASDFNTLSQAERSDEQAAALLNEFLNQWLSGMNKLRWRDLELPVRSWGMEQAPRMVSGNTALAWSARWSSLRRLSVPQAGDAWTALSAYLRQRGLGSSATALETEVATLDAAMRGAAANTPPDRLLAAARAVDAVTHTLSKDIATVLAVQLEFSADDGD